MRWLICLFAAASVSFYSCVSHSGRPEPDSGIYTSEYITKMAQTDYEGAMRLVEEGLHYGRFSVFQAYYLYANLTYTFTEQYEEAANYMKKALEQQEAQEPKCRAELLYHLSTIQRGNREFTGLLATCAEGRACAKSAKLAFLEQSFDFMAGNGLFDIGEEPAGLDLMQSALAKAGNVASSEFELGHLIYFSVQYINVLIELQDYRQVLDKCSDLEDLIARMVKKYPQANPSHMDRFHFYLDLNYAIAYYRTGDKAAAEESFKKACAHPFAHTVAGNLRLVDYYAASGDPASILAIYGSELPYTSTDTVRRDYRMRLSRLRDAYANAGMLPEAGSLQKRVEKLSRLIEEKEMSEGVFVNAAKYDAIRYRFQLADTEKALKINRWILFLIATVLVIASVMLLYTGRVRSRQHHDEVASLKKSLNSIQRQVFIISDQSESKQGPQTSFRELIEGKQLFLDKNLNRENAAAILGISPNMLSKMLNEIEPGISFPDYIKGLRIRYALELLSQNPDIPISELADKCGFYTVRTLQRSFLAVTGKTPSEYAKGLKNI